MARYFVAHYNPSVARYEAINNTSVDKSFEAVSGSDANGQAALLTRKTGKFVSFPVDGVAAAALTTTCVNTDSNITYTANTVGPDGTSIRIAYVVSGTDTPLSVSVSGTSITVNVATNAGGAPTSTASDIKALIDGDLDASALVSTSIVGGIGTGIVNAFGFRNLTDGSPKATVTTTLVDDNANLTFTANAEGVNGNKITVEYIVSGAETPLSVTVVGTDIVVNVETDLSELPISTALDVLALINSDLDASALVIASLPSASDGTGVVDSMSPLSLSGGQYGGVTATNVEIAPATTQTTTIF